MRARVIRARWPGSGRQNGAGGKMIAARSELPPGRHDPMADWKGAHEAGLQELRIPHVSRGGDRAQVQPRSGAGGPVAVPGSVPRLRASAGRRQLGARHARHTAHAAGAARASMPTTTVSPRCSTRPRTSSTPSVPSCWPRWRRSNASNPSGGASSAGAARPELAIWLGPAISPILVGEIPARAEVRPSRAARPPPRPLSSRSVVPPCPHSAPTSPPDCPDPTRCANGGSPRRNVCRPFRGPASKRTSGATAASATSTSTATPRRRTVSRPPRCSGCPTCRSNAAG